MAASVTTLILTPLASLTSTSENKETTTENGQLLECPSKHSTTGDPPAPG